MQDGDLEIWTTHRILVVLEGVLATVTPIIETHRWKRDEITGWDLAFHDTPLKRMLYMEQTFHDVAFDIVTFHPQDVADQAADYLAAIPIPFDTIAAVDYRQFCSKLRFRSDVRQIIDSDPDRLHNYGQLGRQVLIGGDF